MLLLYNDIFTAEYAEDAKRKEEKEMGAELVDK
jgi:hypothetical protein